MPEPKFHQKIAWFNFICCLMVIWTHSGNADLFFPELGQDAPWWHFQYPVMQEILRVDIPCFIMLSAYLFYRNFTMKRLGEKLNKRLHSLLVPSCSGILSTTWRMWRRAGFRDCRRSPTGWIW